MFLGVTVRLPVPPLQPNFLFPVSHPSPEVFRLSLLFPSPGCSAHLLTCLHCPHQPHSISTGPLPLFQCHFVLVVLGLAVLFLSVCCFSVLSAWACLSTCPPVCHQLPVYYPPCRPTWTCLLACKPPCKLCVWVQSCCPWTGDSRLTCRSLNPALLKVSSPQSVPTANRSFRARVLWVSVRWTSDVFCDYNVIIKMSM